MIDRRLRPNIVILLLALLICLSVWQILSGPGPPTLIPEVAPVLTAFTLNTPNTTYKYPIDTLNETDYAQLIDLRNFSFKMLSNACNDTAPFLIILVHSASRNVAKRKTIRETWGRRLENLKVVFMLGEVVSEARQRLLDKENDMYGDFVQGTFLDSYRNVTYKHVMAFKYVVYHCSHAKYILKTDDDVFVNINTLMDYLQSDLSPHGVSDLLLCNVHTDAYALRTYRSKWRISFKEYPYRRYPAYCPGWVLLYSPNVLFNLYKEAQKNTYLWIDDVFITGLLFKKLNLRHTDVEPLVLSEYENKQIVDFNSTDFFRTFLFGQPQLSQYEIRRLWSYTECLRGRCSPT